MENSAIPTDFVTVASLTVKVFKSGGIRDCWSSSNVIHIHFSYAIYHYKLPLTLDTKTYSISRKLEMFYQFMIMAKSVH